MIVPSSHNFKPSEKVEHKIYQVPYKPGFLGDLIRIELEGSKLQFLLKVTEALTNICESFLNNAELVEELKGFDLIVYHSLAVCPAVMLGERLDIPRVEILPVPLNYPFALNHMIPMPVSYVPQAFTGFSDKMTFMERVVNLGAYLEGVLNVAECFGTNLFKNIVYNRPVNADALKVKYNIKPHRSFLEAVADAELVIITADFALEHAQPLLPGRSFLLR